MCIGISMQVLENDGVTALRGETDIDAYFPDLVDAAACTA